MKNKILFVTQRVEQIYASLKHTYTRILPPCAASQYDATLPTPHRDTSPITFLTGRRLPLTYTRILPIRLTIRRFTLLRYHPTPHWDTSPVTILTGRGLLHSHQDFASPPDRPSLHTTTWPSLHHTVKRHLSHFRQGNVYHSLTPVSCPCAQPSFASHSSARAGRWRWRCTWNRRDQGSKITTFQRSKIRHSSYFRSRLGWSNDFPEPG